jgi:hypothetical protein
VVPAEPGQHAIDEPPGPAKQVPALQQMSLPMFVHVPAAPPVAPGAPVQSPVFVTQFPVLVLQT